MPQNQLQQGFQEETPNEKYLHSLEFDKILEIVSKYANTAPGAEKCLALRPFTNKDTIEKELNFVSENKYCCQCGGLLESSYCSFPKWDWELHCNVKIVVCFMWQAIERMMNCIFRSDVMCYIYYVYT